MRHQYRQRQTSALNEQGKNDIPVRCQGACAKFRRFLEILQNILISKLYFICINIDQSRRILFDFLPKPSDVHSYRIFIHKITIHNCNNLPLI